MWAKTIKTPYPHWSKVSQGTLSFFTLVKHIGAKIGQGRFLAGERQRPQNALCFKYFYIVGRAHNHPQPLYKNAVWAEPT